MGHSLSLEMPRDFKPERAGGIDSELAKFEIVNDQQRRSIGKFLVLLKSK
jgi:hypothetical protein